MFTAKARQARLTVERLEERDTPSVTLGAYNPATGTFYLSNSFSTGRADAGIVTFGGSYWKPLAGDWDGDGDSTIGVVDPASATFYLRDSNDNNGPPDHAFRFGGSSWVPLAGDWDDDGDDTVGAFDPATATWYLRNANDNNGPPDHVFQFGAPGWLPLVGDWNNDGRDTIGVWDGSGDTNMYLRNSNDNNGPPDQAFSLWSSRSIPSSFNQNLMNRKIYPFGWEWRDEPLNPGQPNLFLPEWRVGWYDPDIGRFLRITRAGIRPDHVSLVFGGSDWVPLSGDWDNATVDHW
jgi:hypothetical protein